MSKETKLIPELRFPEFLNKGQWTKTRLADFNDVESGDGDWILSKDISPNGEYRIVQLSSIGFGGFKEKTLKTITIDKFGELNGTPIQKGDLLINRMVDSDKINSCIFPFDGKYVTSVDVCWIRQNRAFNNYFMMSLICTGSNQRNLLSLSSGAGRVRISKTNLFEKFVFPFPKVPEEQQKIASCLSSLDELIAAHNEKLDALKDHKKGLLQNLFPQEGETVPKVRFPEFEDDGEWVETTLEEVADYENGKAHEKDIDENGDYIVVNSKFISSEGETVKYSDTAFCPANLGDILMVLSDVPNGKAIAKCFYVDEENRYSVNQRICRITATDCNSRFLFYIMDRNAYFLSFDDGVKQTNLRKSDVLEFPFRIPTDPVEQTKIASCITAIDDLIRAQTFRIEELNQHKRGLMQGLFPKIER